MATSKQQRDVDEVGASGYSMADELRTSFPYGHPGFIPLTLAEMKLHSDKNHDYAGGGRPLGNFERVAAILKMYPGFPIASEAGVMAVYMLKQLDAVFWMMSQGHESLVAESKAVRCGDVSVYAKLMRLKFEEDAKEVRK